MNKEKSCGAVVYKYDDLELKILLEQHNQGHWSSPKGHVEHDETESETALREIKEETNLDVELDTNFRKVITYSPKPNVMKDVVFFVAKAKTFDVKPQDSEISQIKWLTKEEVLERVSFEEDKDVFASAIKYIENIK